MLPYLRGFLGGWLVLLSALLFSCHLSQDSQVVKTLSFTQHFDSLSRYDRVVIEVKDPDGKLLAVIFDAKAETPGQLDNLEVPGWRSGPITIIITGYLSGRTEPVFREEKRFNPSTRENDTTITHIHPHPTLSSTSLELRLTVGQRLALPAVKVAPADLADPALQWSSDNPAIASVDGGNLLGIAAGSTRLTVAIGTGADQQVAFTVVVETDLRAPNSLDLTPSVLNLARGGAPKWFAIAVEPAGASRDVEWRIKDSTLVVHRADGGFTGLAMGQTWVYAVSKLNPLARDSGLIEVGAPVPVASVRFLREDTLDLYLGGAPESLQVEVLPAQANPEVRFSLSDSTKATLSGPSISAKALGGFTLFARSVEDSTKTDLLSVMVREPVSISGVAAADQQVTLYVGGPGRTLTAQVMPVGSPQGVRWKSLSPGNVSVVALTGEIAPLQPGLSQLVVTSQADTSARDTVEVTVKADVPRVTLEASDTLVSAGARVSFQVTIEQEFGSVAMLQWDLDGDMVYEDSANGNWTGTTVRPTPIFHTYARAGAVTARVRVRDSEGFHGQATRALRVVGGSAVTIESPKHNSQTNQAVIPVEWSVNAVRQDSLTSERLAVEGPNVIRRFSRDSLGKVVGDSVTVHLDTTKPSAPAVSGTSPTNVKPMWTWTGGGGGSGEFRIRLGDGNFPANAPTRRDSAFVLDADPVSGTAYTLFVQERDLAGNWSLSSSRAIRYDISKPVVAITAPLASGTHYLTSATAVLTGTAAGPLPITKVTYRLGTGAEAAATLAAGGWSTPAVTLTEGVTVVVTVTATDEAGNTGEASLSLHRDNTPPLAPANLTGPAAEISAVLGSFSWSAGSDGTTGSGLNGRYRYNVNGGAWTETSETLVTDLALASGNNTFSVQEQDRALNWSPSASRVVKVDTAGPVITLTGSNPRASASLTVSLAGTVRDSSGTPTMTITGQQPGSGAVTVTGTSWSTSVTLLTGANTLTLTAADRLGNDRILTIVVNVNVPAPVVVITNPADSLTVTNQGTIAVSFTIDGGATQTQNFTLDTEGVNRLVVSSSPSASGNIGRDTVKVTRDMGLPNAPTLNRGTTPTNGSATWTWTSNGDNAGGAGVRSPNAYRYSLNAGSTWTTTGATTHSIATEGSHTLVVQEQDRAGNWSASSAAQAIVVDKTAPSVSITSPTRDNIITNQPTAPIQYRVDAGPVTQMTCTLTVANGRNTCRARAADVAGNVGLDSVYVWRRANVIFVTQAGAGLGTGNDWENAMSAASLPGAVDSRNAEGKTFWIATGTYPALIANYNNVTLLGGFVASGFPYDPANRQLNVTTIESFHVGNGVTATVDGFRSNLFSGGTTPTLIIRDVTIIPTTTNDVFCAFFFQNSGSTITATNLVVEDSYYTYSVFVLDGNLTLTGGSIRDNLTDTNPLLVSGNTTLNAPFVISGNQVGSSVNGDYQARVYASGRLTVGRNVALSCAPAAGQVFVTTGGTCTNQ